jgi:uncharacterized protein involved in response to NO
MRINEPTQGKDIAPLWRLAFRAGFLAAAAFGIAAMLRWLFWMRSPADWPGAIAPQWWHGHEMVFGFALPVVAGFLLTAVATWTGIAGTRGVRLQVLFGLWLLARALLWLAPGLHWLAWLADLGFLLLTGLELTRRVAVRRQWRNLLFTPVLLLLGLLDLASHANVGNGLASMQLHYGAIWMVTVLVVIIGGRVTPLFTANRLGISITPLPLAFEALAIGSTVLAGLLAVLLPPGETRSWLQFLYLATGLLHLFRLLHWRGWLTLREPLLWSMHLAYLYIPLALFALALAGGDPVAQKNAMHLLAVGTIGGMILAMMARVSLGHTGRPLVVPTYLAVGFALVLLAALVRALLPMLAVSLTAQAWQLSAVLWILAFSAFLWRYLPILTRARVDNKPG